jgi:ATP synthase protein I
MESGGAQRVGERGNGHDGPHLGGEGQSHQRHENESPVHDDDILRARLEKLTDALAAQHRDERKASATSQEQEGAETSPAALGNVLNLAFRVMSEFIAAVIVGAGIGWGLDRVAGTSPIFLIVFLLMGAATGFWNVYRIGTEKPGADTK